ncbi:MAG: argininosuccinate lyase [Candidatus Riflebacteria bacterium]|nr:argininosuccinate lyase [Candidatus Riflebacteria bacterium]
MTLWDKGGQLETAVARFTAGEDPKLDIVLLPFDCQGSRAHARGLYRIGLLTAEELAGIETELKAISAEAETGKIVISQEQEDCHTYIEDRLTRVLGEAGKKIHAGRSRNDQVLTALRLYQRDRLGRVREEVIEFQKSLAMLVARWGDLPLPGFTHTRQAMPSSVRRWAGAYIDALSDDIPFIDAVSRMLDQSPLGTGAGYGIPLPLDREFTSAEMGFGRVQENPIYAQLSRGKFDLAIFSALVQLCFSLNRLASDIILFSLSDFGLINIPDRFCTGSSLMPQKKNPDLLELMRASLHVVTSAQSRTQSINANLISGYHRDVQWTKRPLFEAFDVTIDSLSIAALLIDALEFSEERCRKAMTPDLFATERVCELVRQGVSFREAYRRIAAEFSLTSGDKEST